MATQKISASELNTSLANRLYDSLKDVEITPLTTSLNISEILASGMSANDYLKGVLKSNEKLENDNFQSLLTKVEKFGATLTGAEKEEFLSAKTQTNHFATTFKAHLGSVENTKTKATANGFRTAFNSVNLLRKKGSSMDIEISAERKAELIKWKKLDDFMIGLLKPNQWRQMNAQYKDYLSEQEKANK